MIRRKSFPQGAIPLRFAAVTLFLVGCSATGEEPGPSGGSGGSPGGAPAGGQMGVSGQVGVAGSGVPTSGSGGTSSMAGSAGTGTAGSSAGAPAGGAMGTAGAGVAGTGTAGAGTAGAPSTCAGAKGDKASPMLYDGNQTTCTNALTPPRTGYWFTYNDGTAMQMPMAAAGGAIAGELGGKGGATDCAMHTSGMEFTKWGAGLGFDIHSVAGKGCPFDASVFAGIRFYAKGTTTGTHGLAYAAAPNTIRIKIKMATDLMGDDYGGWCTLGTEWTLCDIPFAMVAQEGYGTKGIPFSAAELTQIQFQAAKEGMESMPPTVSFDFWIDDVTFY